MVAHNRSSVNPHRLRIVIPIRSDDDHRWIEFAGNRMAERFERAVASRGIAGFGDEDGGTDIMPVVILTSYTPTLTDLDQTILFGIGLRVYEGLGERAGVAVMVDDDPIVF